jgi:GTP cyclohydrolase III
LSPPSPGPLRAQTQDEPVFDSYEEMRATLDDLMSKRQIADLLTAFGGGDEMTLQDMAVLETQVRNLFPRISRTPP